MSEKVRENYNKPSVQNTSRTTDTRQTYRPNQTSKSPFEKLLDKTTNSTDGKNTGLLGTSPTETQEAIQATTSQGEKYSGDKGYKESFEKKLKDRENDSDEGKGGIFKEGTSSARDADRRVVSRDSHDGSGREGRHQGEHSSQGQSHGQSGGHSSGGQNKGGGQGKNHQGSDKHDSEFLSGLSQKSGRVQKASSKFEMKGRIEASSEAILSPTSSQVLTKKMQEMMKAQAVLSQMKALPKEMLDQIVMYSRLMTRTDGDKEWTLQLKEEVFQGLKLKVRTRGGKIEATLVASNEEVERFFKAHQEDLDKLKEQMKEKGIEVTSIRVIMEHSNTYERPGIPV